MTYGTEHYNCGYYKNCVAFDVSTAVYLRAHGGVVVKALRYKLAGHGLIPDDVIGIFQ